MRTQKIITIDTGAEGQRQKYEPVSEFHKRIDEVLAREIRLQQLNIGDEWYLLSVVPAGSNFVSGVYLSTWEYDDEDETNTTTIVDELQDWKNGEKTKDCSDEDSVAEDGDTSPHVQHGEIIRVNGVRFILTGFQRDNGGATVEFSEYDEYLKAMESWAQPQFVMHHTETPRRSNRYPYGVESPVTYNSPRRYRG